jgi:probable F420-dependent oxidoreductase
MKIGAVYPQTELHGDPEAVRRIAASVEALGYDYLLAFDHVLGATHDREPKLTGPYMERHPFHDPLVMFAHVAAITRRIELVTGVLILPQRQTVLVARQAADLDLLSGGRLRLGVGIGWNYVEYEALGQSFTTRGRREEEQIGLLRRLWTEPLVEFKGEFDRVDRAALNPRPRRLIPIWLGGFSEPAYQRAARLADGFIFIGEKPRAREGWQRVAHHLSEAGRDAGAFGKEMVVGRVEATPAEVAASIEWSRDWGCTHVAVSTMGKGFGTIDAHTAFLAEVGHRIGLRVTG